MVEFVEIDKCQRYIAQTEPRMVTTDNLNLWLCDCHLWKIAGCTKIW